MGHKIMKSNIRKTRILHVHLALYQPWLISRALRKIGYKADYVIFEWAKKHGWLIHGYDFDLDYKKEKVISKIRSLGFFLWAIKNYDIFHFHRPSSFLPFPTPDSFFYGYDLAILRKLGKKIVYSHWGCNEGRIPSNFSKNGGEYICGFCKQRFGDCSDKKVIGRHYIQTKYANAIINHDPEFKDFNFGAVYIPGIIDTDLWKPDEDIPDKYKLKPKSANTIRIYHSISNSQIRGGNAENTKGTQYVTSAVEQLKKEGYDIEFIFFDRVPNPEVRFYQLQADIIVDQLLYGWYGSNAREAMSLGKPVIVYLREELSKFHPDLPIVNANIHNIKEVLKKLIDSPELRNELGQKGRQFAQKVHAGEVIAKQIAEVYESF
jgi:glycosyltransferase involved in cell wall biosynthesis